MKQRYEVKPITNAQIRAASLTLTRAFMDDPMMTYIVPDEAKRFRPLAAFFETSLKFGQLNGEVYTTDMSDGAAVWLGPGHVTLSLPAVVRSRLLVGLLKGFTAFGLGGFDRLLNVGDYTEKNHKRFMPEAHWYLVLLGVEPAQQGKGFGGALMQPVLTKADAAGMPCYLETMKAQNVPIYQRYNFKVVDEGTIPKGGLRVWSMRREPQR